MNDDADIISNENTRKKNRNKAGYTAQDAPSTRLKITRDGRTYGPTDGRTDDHGLLLRCDGASKKSRDSDVEVI